MRNAMKRLLPAVATAAMGLAVSVSPAFAGDYGDGKLSCNSGEICLSKHYGDYTWQKHFWYGASHSGYYWTNVNTGSGGTAVVNSASAIKNRDTSCAVKVVDDRGWLPDNYATFASGDTVWRYVGSELNDRNDRHERC